MVCGSCALAFLRCAPAFLAAVGASWGWAERLLLATLRAQVKETVSVTPRLRGITEGGLLLGEVTALSPPSLQVRSHGARAMGLIGRGGPAPRRRARSLEAGLLLLRLRAAHARTCPHAGKWGGGGSPSLPCVAPCARVSRAGAYMRMDEARRARAGRPRAESPRRNNPRASPARARSRVRSCIMQAHAERGARDGEARRRRPSACGRPPVKHARMARHKGGREGGRSTTTPLPCMRARTCVRSTQPQEQEARLAHFRPTLL